MGPSDLPRDQGKRLSTPSPFALSGFLSDLAYA